MEAYDMTITRTTRTQTWFSNGFGVKLTGPDSGTILRRSFRTGRARELMGKDFEKFGMTCAVACAMVAAGLEAR